jgi:hypothetical protein
MARFNTAKAFKQVRAESQRQKKAVIEAGRRKHEEWVAYGRRSAALNYLMNLFPGESTGTVDVRRATALMVEYAQTLPVEWVKARVKSVSDRLAKLAAAGKPARDASLKEILLNLLQLASARDNAKVAEIFNEVTCGDLDDVETFRLCLVNWLVDKVVDEWPPLPDELTIGLLEVEAAAEVGSNTAGGEEWLPASIAVERAERSGHPITLKWLTRDSSKHGVRTRPQRQGGRHKQEVEWSSLAGYLLKQARLATESDEGELSCRVREAQEQRRTERPLD